MKILALILFFNPAFAQDPSMNGYTLRQFGNFSKEWRLVTVRYRKDTGEMRFTYANDLAWKTLQANKTDYPDGSIFAKIGAMSMPDPGFVNSMVPSGARRVQFMVRDQKKHKDTDGWGYALFDKDGKLYPGDVKAASNACMACHRLVPERGQVFSQTMFLEKFSTNAQSKLGFVDAELKPLPESLRAKIPPHFTKVRDMTGPLKDRPFFGTLDEVQPFLAQESAAKDLPAVFVSLDKKQFSAVIPLRKSCEGEPGQMFMGLHTLEGKSVLYVNSFCQSTHP